MSLLTVSVEQCTSGTNSKTLESIEVTIHLYSKGTSITNGHQKTCTLLPDPEDKQLSKGHELFGPKRLRLTASNIKNLLLSHVGEQYDEATPDAFKFDIKVKCRSLSESGDIFNDVYKGSVQGYLCESTHEEVKLKNSPLKLVIDLQPGVIIFTSLKDSTFNGVKCLDDPISLDTDMYICPLTIGPATDEIIHRNSSNAYVKKYPYSQKSNKTLSALLSELPDAVKLSPIDIKATNRQIYVYLIIRKSDDTEIDRRMIKRIEGIVFDESIRKFAKKIIIKILTGAVPRGEVNPELQSKEFECKFLCNMESTKEMLRTIGQPRDDVAVKESQPIELDQVVYHDFVMKIPGDIELPNKSKHRLLLWDLSSKFDAEVYQRLIDQIDMIHSNRQQLKVSLYVNRHLGWEDNIGVLREDAETYRDNYSVELF